MEGVVGESIRADRRLLKIMRGRQEDRMVSSNTLLTTWRKRKERRGRCAIG